MKKPFIANFRFMYIVDTFMKIMVNRVRSGEWHVPEITPEELNDLIESDQSPLLIYNLRLVGEDGLIPGIKRMD